MIEAIATGTAKIMYGLTRVHDPKLNKFDYVLRARLPVNNTMVEIKLDLELGRTLAQYWNQNDYGTFLGRHTMEWVITHLKEGITI